MKRPWLHASRFSLDILVCFALLGFGFLFLEIPLVQRLILFVGKPVYALVAVLFGLLLFSGLGSVLPRRIPWRGVLAALAILALAYPILLSTLFRSALGQPPWIRFTIGVISLAPLGGVDGDALPQGNRLAGTHVA